MSEGLSALSLQLNLFSTLSVRQSLQGLTAGSGIGIAVIDSGIQPGVDFGSRISSFYDFTNGDIRAVSASDLFGHGTHVAGLIGGAYIGVAPATRLIGLKVLDGREWNHRQRHPGHRVRHRQQRRAEDSRPQPFAGPSDLRIGRDGSAGSGCRARGARGPRPSSSRQAITA